VDAQHLAKHRGGVLRVAAGFNMPGTPIIPRATIATSNIEITLVTWAWAEPDPAAIMVFRGLIVREQR